MKLLVVTHYWPPHQGGVERLAWEQARRLARRGHSVTVVTSRLSGDPAVSRAAGLLVERVPASDLLGRRGIPYPLFAPTLVSRLNRAARASDVVLVHSHGFMSSVVGTLMARALDRPVLLLQHNPFVRYRFPLTLAEHLHDALLGRPTLALASQIAAVSRFTAAYARTLAPGRAVAVMHPGVDTAAFRPAAAGERARLRAALGWPAEAFVVLTVRRLVFRNGLDVLIDAAARWQERSEILTVIGGDGPDRDQLQQAITGRRLERVRLLGRLSDETLADCYRAADLFVLPTRTGEGFGLVILEALASGLPVIATRSGGPAEVISEGETGLLVDAGDATALAAAVRHLHDQPAERARLAAGARAQREWIDWEAHVDRLETVLRSLATDR